jgi:hypothetical protein
MYIMEDFKIRLTKTTHKNRPYNNRRSYDYYESNYERDRRRERERRERERRERERRERNRLIPHQPMTSNPIPHKPLTLKQKLQNIAIFMFIFLIFGVVIYFAIYGSSNDYGSSTTSVFEISW